MKPEKTVQTKKKTIEGKIFIEDRLLHQATELEIAPIGNDKYTITIKMILDDSVRDEPIDQSKKTQYLRYRHRCLPFELTFKVNLLDSGILDAEDKCVLVLFYMGEVQAPIVEQHKIQNIIRI